MATRLWQLEVHALFDTGFAHGCFMVDTDVPAVLLAPLPGDSPIRNFWVAFQLSAYEHIT